MGEFARINAPSLSSQTVEIVGKESLFKSKAEASSSISQCIGSNSLILCESAMYLASIAEHAISIWSFDAHRMGVFPNVRTKPAVLLFSHDGSWSFSQPHRPAKLASQKQSSVQFVSLLSHGTTGDCGNIEHTKCTAIAISGHVVAARYINMPTTEL
eukprot:2572194-Ditylum_brightwellii.AAC.1